jgi:hypothetical protein
MVSKQPGSIVNRELELRYKLTKDPELQMNAEVIVLELECGE